MFDGEAFAKVLIRSGRCTSLLSFRLSDPVRNELLCDLEVTNGPVDLYLHDGR